MIFIAFIDLIKLLITLLKNYAKMIELHVIDC